MLGTLFYLFPQPPLPGARLQQHLAWRQNDSSLHSTGPCFLSTQYLASFLMAADQVLTHLPPVPHPHHEPHNQYEFITIFTISPSAKREGMSLPSKGQSCHIWSGLHPLLSPQQLVFLTSNYVPGTAPDSENRETSKQTSDL